MNRTTLRTSAKHRRCACGTHIMPGDQYLEQVISPDHGDVGNETWWRAAELLEALCQDHLAKADGHVVRMFDETVEQLTLAGVA